MTPKEALDELYKIADDETVGTSMHQAVQDAFAVLQKIIEPSQVTNYEKLFSSQEMAAETLCNSSMPGYDDKYTESFIPAKIARARTATVSAMQTQEDTRIMRHNINKRINDISANPYSQRFALPDMHDDVSRILYPELIAAGYKIVPSLNFIGGMVTYLSWEEEEPNGCGKADT